MKKDDRIKLEGLKNPFMVLSSIETTSITVTNKMVNVNDIKEGIITSLPSQITSTLMLDKEEYCKVFTRAGFRLHVTAMSPNAKSLYMWLMYELDYSVDFIEINKKRYVNESKLNYKQYQLAIKELIDFCVISPTSVNDVYWTNSLFFFKGDRLKKYPECVR